MLRHDGRQAAMSCCTNPPAYRNSGGEVNRAVKGYARIVREELIRSDEKQERYVGAILYAASEVMAGRDQAARPSTV